MVQDIYIISNNNELYNLLTEIFKNDKEYKFLCFSEDKVNDVLQNIPSLIIIDEDGIENGRIMCQTIRQNEDNSITPIIVVSSKTEHEHQLSVLKLKVSHFIKKPIDKEYLYYTVKNIIYLLYINRRVSPLTGLPGNVQIQAEIKKRFIKKETFAMMYLDLDNFKAYNDVYGFLKGDEIIKFTARTIIKGIHELNLEDSFVGHIGGDDFVAIVPETDYEKICQNIIANFDKNVNQFFTEDDIEKGYIEVANRKGIIEEFPLTSISIGVVEVKKGKFNNTLEIAEVGASVKHLAKTIQGSTYVIDRRSSEKI